MTPVVGQDLCPDATHRTVEVGPGLHLHVAELGPADGIPVLFLHGFPEAWFSWRHQLPALAAAGFRCIAPDLRGYGASSAPQGVRPYRLDRLLDDLDALQRSLGVGRWHVVGHDWGGVLAWALAMARPETLRRLVVLDAPHPVPYLRECLRGHQLRKSWSIFAFQVPDLPERVLARPRILPHMLAGPGRALTDAERRAYRAAFPVPCAFRGPLAWYRALLRYELWTVRSRIRRIDLPTLVLWGEQDPILDPALTEGLEGQVTDLHVERLAGAGHFPHHDQPGRVNERLVAFLAG
ncbi:MAG: alpha/beta hydrolase [Alphaproteobacteria bacterium]|nr:alpha/beta hydrolase [Alphaproteobacteria bacterium]